MKRLLFITLLCSLPMYITAQETDKEATLPEIEIKAAKVINKPDGKLIYPTDIQKASSTSGYSLLNKLSLPNVRINEINHSISAIDNRGVIQLRINGIEVQKEDLLTLQTKDVKNIDFIDNPGVKYGENTAYVINIITKRSNKGFSTGINSNQSITTKQGDNLVYAKWNRGKSEIALNYNFGYNDNKGTRIDEVADYKLTDGTIYSIERHDIESRRRSLNNNINLIYNIADSTKYLFQIKLSNSFNNTPGNYNKKMISEASTNSIATQKEKSRSSSPAIDLYYFNQLTAKQSITINSVGTYIGTTSSNSYDEGNPYCYDVKGKSYSLISEAIYENRLKTFTLSAGLSYTNKYTSNEYTGDVKSDHPMHNSNIYGFAEIKGSLSKFRYTAGIGTSNTNYSQEEHKYNFWLFRPKASVSYSFTDAIQAKYDFQSYEHVSRIAMISNAMIRNNSMEWTQGNPEIEPNRELTHTITLSYQNPRLTSSIEGFYKICQRPNMALYERTDDNRFIYSQKNQKEIDVLNIMAYSNYWLLPEKLSLAASASLFRCFNYGDDYTHCRTSYQFQASVNAYIKMVTLSAYIDNGYKFLEGETKGNNGSYSELSGSYSLKQWQFSLSWQMPLQDNPRLFYNEIINKDMNKKIYMHNNEGGSIISLSVAWKFNKGKKYNSIDRKINRNDTDNGILISPR